MITSAMRKFGIDRNSDGSDRNTVPPKRFGRWNAASAMPKAKTVAMRNAVPASWSVAGMPSQSTAVTGRFELMDSPRSPWTSRSRAMPSCSHSERSRL